MYTEVDAAPPPLLMPSAPRRAPIDIEHLIQWAVNSSGKLPWYRDRLEELSYDKGLTAKLRRRPKVGWVEASVTAGLYRQGAPLSATATPSGDIAVVLDAIKRLPPPVASVVLRCARLGIRPDCMLGVVPVQVEKRIYVRKRGRRKGRHTAKTILAWDIEPALLRAVRDEYSRWHAGVERVRAGLLLIPLRKWEISGFAAPSTPWESERNYCNVMDCGGDSRLSLTKP